MESIFDYATTGLNLCEAMLDMAARYPERAKRPEYILWKGLQIRTADCWHVPAHGIARVEMLSKKIGIDHGVDLKIEGGAVQLKQGEEISLLRTWADSHYEDVVEYPYFSHARRLWVWNVYRVKLPSGQLREERWTGNAGFWVERLGDHQRIYHCSHGAAVEPDFDSFTFSVTVLPMGDRKESPK